MLLLLLFCCCMMKFSQLIVIVLSSLSLAMPCYAMPTNQQLDNSLLSFSIKTKCCKNHRNKNSVKMAQVIILFQDLSLLSFAIANWQTGIDVI